MRILSELILFQKCDSCEILPPAPAQFADSSPEEINKVSIWWKLNIISLLGDLRKHACVCGGDWFVISERSRECGREGRHEDDKILTSPLERWATSPHLLDSWKHFICVPSYPSKAKIYIGCVFIFSSLDCCDRREKEDKREQMREKLVRGGKNTKQVTWFLGFLDATFWLQFFRKV